MNEQVKKRIMRTAILCAVALVIGAAIGFIQINSQGNNAEVISKGSTPAAMPGVQVGGPFTLVNQDGEMVTQDSYAGQYKLVYFGFTMCPMICPAGLQKVAKVLNTLEQDGENIAPIFITVDPERDTPDVMKEYVVQFHPRLIGLTGSKEQIRQVEKTYRVFSSKVEDEAATEYTMDHSSFTYLMSPDDQLLALYRDSDTAEFMADDIQKKLFP